MKDGESMVFRTMGREKTEAVTLEAEEIWVREHAPGLRPGSGWWVAVLALWEKKQHPAGAHPAWGTVQGCVWVLAGNDISSRADQCQALQKSAPTRAFRGELAGLDNATSEERETQTRLAEKEHTDTGNIWSDGLIACGQNSPAEQGQGQLRPQCLVGSELQGHGPGLLLESTWVNQV